MPFTRMKTFLTPFRQGRWSSGSGVSFCQADKVIKCGILAVCAEDLIMIVLPVRWYGNIDDIVPVSSSARMLPSVRATASLIIAEDQGIFLVFSTSHSLRSWCRRVWYGCRPGFPGRDLLMFSAASDGVASGSSSSCAARASIRSVSVTLPKGFQVRKGSRPEWSVSLFPAL